MLLQIDEHAKSFLILIVEVAGKLASDHIEDMGDGIKTDLKDAGLNLSEKAAIKDATNYLVNMIIGEDDKKRMRVGKKPYRLTKVEITDQASLALVSSIRAILGAVVSQPEELKNCACDLMEADPEIVSVEDFIPKFHWMASSCYDLVESGLTGDLFDEWQKQKLHNARCLLERLSDEVEAENE